MRRRFLSDFHFSLLAVVLFLCIVGIFNLYSATYQNSSHQYLTQMYWMIGGLILMTIFVVLDYRIFERFSYPLYFMGLVLLAAVLVVGPKIYGARRWLDLGFFRLQPSELMKIGMVFVLAKFFHDDHAVGGYSLRRLMVPFLIVGVPVLLILAEPDLGTALLICFSAFSVFMFVKIRWQSLLMIFIVAALTLPIAYKFVLKDYQRDRVRTFLDPSRDPRGKGYHALQSMIAVGSGKIRGKGHLKGSQTQLAFLPEQHTDFIFSVFAEEHGFVGVMILMIVYAMMVLMGLEVARHARDKFGALLAIGVTSVFFWQSFINIGMVIGFLPVVGITLPFFSYGGSSIIISFIGIGLLLSIHLRRFMF